jgi:hypothetical protein
MELNFNENSIVYVIDTSALIKLEVTFPPDNEVFIDLWEEIIDLIKLKQFITIDFVEDEINNYEGKEVYLKNWVKKYKKHLVVETDIDTFNFAKSIINQEYTTGFFDAKKQAEGKEEADPYLIAFCKVHNYTLVTNESETKPNKIPAVAKKNGVKCINIYNFLQQRGMKMQRTKR